MALGGDDAGGDVGQALAAQEGGQRVAGVGAAAVQVALAPDEQAQALGEGRGAQGQRDAGRVLAEPGEGRSEHGLHPHRGGSDAEAAGAAGARVVELLLGGDDLAQHAARQRRGGVAEGGGADPGGQAFEQPAAEAGLEPGDGPGERRLGDGQPFRRGEDLSLLGDDPEHREASGWAGRGAEELGLKGPVDPETFRAVLEGKVPDGSGTELGRRGKDGEILHRPGRDLTFSAPKSVSLAALVGGDRRIVEVHDRAVAATLAWVEKNAAETRMKDPDTGRMVRAGGQKIVAATFRHDSSRNLDPQLHTHSVIANMVQGQDGKWRSMANEGLYARQKLIGMLYRNELAAGLARLGYDIEKTHADGRFEIADPASAW